MYLLVVVLAAVMVIVVLLALPNKAVMSLIVRSNVPRLKLVNIIISIISISTTSSLPIKKYLRTLLRMR
jgi:hypothetical protein